jgi:CubicO group peptidase (beta-lactamase class C family)
MPFISKMAMTVLLAGIAGVASEESFNRTVDAIFADLTKPGSPGCALGVYRDGKIVYARGYGLANLEEDVPITPQSVFDIASVSKQFTAASIVLLERQGKLRLDDDIRKYVPELPDYSSQGGGKITVLELLNHTSGLRDYGNLFPLAGIDDDDVTTDEDALGMIVRQKALNFAPGSEWQYSNSGYLLLSLIVKRVSGRSLKEFAGENIFQPLGMAYMQHRDDHTFLIRHRVQAYSRTQNGAYRLNMSYAEETGDGMVHTTLEDLQKWDENFYSERVGGKNFAAEMEDNGKLNDGRKVEYAKGLRIWRYRGLPAVVHTGGSGGYRAYYIRFPQQHFSVACLCNLEDVNRRKRVGAVAEAYLSGLFTRSDGAVMQSPTPRQLGTFIGTYQDLKTREVWRVSMRDTTLWVDFEGMPLELRALSQTEFEPVDYAFDLHMKFDPQDGTRPRRLVV